MLELTGGPGEPARASLPTQTDLETALVDAKPTSGYRPTLPVHGFTGADLPPIYIFERDIEAMLRHPSVQSPLLFYCSGLIGAEFEVEANSPQVQAFVETTIRDFWDRSLPDVQSAYEYGRIGCEVIYKDDGGLTFEGLQSFSPWDTTPQVSTETNEYVGFTLRNVPGNTDEAGVFLWGPGEALPAKGFWFAHRPRFNSFWGQSQLLGAWRPWSRLARRDGGEEVIDGAVFRHGYTGPLVRCPMQSKTSTLQPSGRSDGTLNDRDAALQMGEQLKAGGVVVLSSAVQEGKYKWDIEFPQHVLNVDPLLNYAKSLKDEISLGIGVPPELLQASEVGSGYSGRAIPLEGYFLGQQLTAGAILEAFVRQVLTPLVQYRFGMAAKFRAKVKPILQQRQKQSADNAPKQPGQEPAAGQAGDSESAHKPPQLNGHPGSNGQSYTGPRGGSGIKNPETGRVRYMATETKTEEAVGTLPISTAIAAQARLDLIAALRHAPPGQWLDRAKEVLDRYSIQFAAALKDARLAAVLLGARDVARSIPSATPPSSLVGMPLTAPSGELPPWTPSVIAGEEMAGDASIRLPLIESAARDLAARGLFPREMFDLLDANARQEAFTVAGVESETAIGKIRDALSETVAKGASMPEFFRRVEEAVGTGTFLSDSHAETVYRTNVQTAYSAGMDTVLNDPMVDDLFPFEETLPIRDNRLTDLCATISRSGIQGTGIFLRADPVYQHFVSPRHWNCRCGRNPMTIEMAAARGITYAQKWLDDGEQPPNPPYVSWPNVELPAGWVRMGTAADWRPENRISQFLSTDSEPRDDSGKWTTGSGHSDKLQSWLSMAAKVPARLKAKAKEKVGLAYAKLTDRYGPRYAKAILAAGLAGLPLPVPGASMVTAAPFIACAELHRAIMGQHLATDTTAPLSEEEIARLGREFMAALLAEWKAEHTQDMATDAEGHEHKGKGEGGGQFTGKGGGGDGVATTTIAKPKQSSGIRLKPTKQRAFSGQAVPLKSPLGKQEAGKIGESIVIAWLQSKGFKDARTACTEKNNFPVDLVQDHELIEVKTGQAGNGPGAQQWRLTIGEPGKEEKAWLATASDEAKAKWNARKQQAIHERKKKVLAGAEKAMGGKVKTAMVTLIINPDTRTADLYRFDGFDHDRIGWNSDKARAGYVGSVSY